MTTLAVTKIWFAPANNMTYQYVLTVDGAIRQSNPDADRSVCVDLALAATGAKYDHSKVDLPTGFVEIFTWTKE